MGQRYTNKISSQYFKIICMLVEPTVEEPSARKLNFDSSEVS